MWRVGCTALVLLAGLACSRFKVATCSSDADCAPYSCDAQRGVCVTQAVASSSSSGGGGSSSTGTSGMGSSSGGRDGGVGDAGDCASICGDPRIAWECTPGADPPDCRSLGCMLPYQSCGQSSCGVNIQTDPNHCGGCNRFITARADHCDGGAPRCGAGAECIIGNACAANELAGGTARCCPTGQKNCNGMCSTGCTCGDGGCTTLFCGDGLPNPGMEQCDDVNMNNDDDCLNTCQDNTCGDGYLRASEDCDDGNLNGSDSCPANCVKNPGRFFAVPLAGGMEVYAVTSNGLLQRTFYSSRALNPPFMTGQGSALLSGYQRVNVDQSNGRAAFPTDAFTPPANTVAMATDVQGRYMCAGLQDGTLHTFLLSGNSTLSAGSNRQSTTSPVRAVAAHASGLGCYTLHENGNLWFHPINITNATLTGASTNLTLAPVPGVGATMLAEPRAEMLWVLDPLAGATRPVVLTAQGPAQREGTSDFTAANGAVSLAFDPSGRFMVRARRDLGVVEVLSMSRSTLGSMTQVDTEPAQQVSHVHVTPRGDMVIATGNDGVARVFGFNRVTGQLTWLSEQLDVHATGKGVFVLGTQSTRQVARHAYVVARADGGVGGVQTYTVAASGAPLTAAGATVMDVLVPETAAVVPGQLALVGVTTNVTAARGYQLGAGDGVPVLSGSPLTINHGPEGRTLCLGGRIPRAYVLGGTGGTAALKTLVVDPQTGAVSSDMGNTTVDATHVVCDGTDLAPVLARSDGVVLPGPDADGGVAVGAVTTMALHPFGRFVFVVSAGTGTVLQRDPSSGTLSQAGTFPVISGTVALAVDAAGVFLAAYSDTAGADNVAMYQVDPRTGAVTDTLARATVGLGARAVSFEPQGNALFVTGNAAGQAFQITFNRQTRAMSTLGSLFIPPGIAGPVLFSRQLQ